MPTTMRIVTILLHLFPTSLSLPTLPLYLNQTVTLASKLLDRNTTLSPPCWVCLHLQQLANLAFPVSLHNWVISLAGVSIWKAPNIRRMPLAEGMNIFLVGAIKQIKNSFLTLKPPQRLITNPVQTDLTLAYQASLCITHRSNPSHPRVGTLPPSYCNTTILLQNPTAPRNVKISGLDYLRLSDPPTFSGDLNKIPTMSSQYCVG
jgi:hypothetical protein